MGKLIVIYGINNLGKSTQAKLLVEKLNSEGKDAIYVKYPIYDISPSGVMLNNYLRRNNTWKMTPREAQIMYAFNRAQYEETVKTTLGEGKIIVAEDYWGTGVAWGAGAGVDLDFMKEINKYFYKEDLAILFEGKRFLDGYEQGHLHESNDELMNKVEVVLDDLGKENDWKRVNANQSIEKVSEDVWNLVKEIIS